MKKILGSLLWCIALFGAQYTVVPDKTSVSLKEPIHLRLRYFTQDKKEIAWIKFEPKPSPAYEVHVLKKRSDDEGYLFDYLIFPLQSKKIEITYLLQLKKAPQQEIQSKILGTGYEQTSPIEGKIYTFEVSPTMINVKDVHADLYGSYTLQLQAQKRKAKAYEPLYVRVRLQGRGYPPEMNDPLAKIEGVQKLQDKPRKKILYKSDGAHVEYIFDYALISKSSFTLPPITLKAYDYHKYYTLQTEPIHFIVTPPSVKPDSSDEPKAIEPSYKALVRFFKLFAIFLGGFVSGAIFLLILYRKFALLFASKEELLSYLALHHPKEYEDLKHQILSGRLWPVKLKVFKISRKDK